MPAMAPATEEGEDFEETLRNSILLPFLLRFGSVSLCFYSAHEDGTSGYPGWIALSQAYSLTGLPVLATLGEIYRG